MMFCAMCLFELIKKCLILLQKKKNQERGRYWVGENTHICKALPAAVPQLGATHHADENKEAKTSGGKTVTCRCTCSRFNTKEKKTPKVKSTVPRKTKLLVATIVTVDPHSYSLADSVDTLEWCW